MLLSALCFQVMSILVKRLAPVLPGPELVFFRSVINAVWVLALMLMLREGLWPKQGKKLLAFRGLVGFAGVLCMFYSLAHLPLPIASMLNWSSPLFVILFSRLLLAERLPMRSVYFVPVAFLGLTLLLDPFGASQGHVVFWDAAIGLLTAVFGGMAYVTVRAVVSKVGANCVVLYFAVVSTLVSAPLMVGHYIAPTPGEWLEIVAMGTLATVAQLAMTRAYRYAAAGVVSMMNLINPVFGAAIGVWLFGDHLQGWQWIGMSCVAVAMVGLTMHSVTALVALMRSRASST